MKDYLVDYKRLEGQGHKKYLYFFYRWFRKAQNCKFKISRNFYRMLFRLHADRHHLEIYTSTQVGLGLCIWHPYNITISKGSIIGKNCTLNRGVLIGREFRGKRNGNPTIGNEVWIGANAAIVGKITIGNNVLIAPNSFINCDVPDNSTVFGNPCVIKENTEGSRYYCQNIDKEARV